MLYPWQQAIWQQLTSATNLAHALVLYGIEGIGKLDFAYQLSQFLLCSQPIQGKFGIQACSQCRNCIWFIGNNHPDFRLLTPTDDTDKSGTGDNESANLSTKKRKKAEIDIEQVRALDHFMSLGSHQHDGRRVVLIAPAQVLNRNAANALLKLLEEPPEGVIFLLVTTQLQRLLPTILSRCQHIFFAPPSQEQALAWLKQNGIEEGLLALAYTGGAPLLCRHGELIAHAKVMSQLLLQGHKLMPHTSATMMMSQATKVPQYIELNLVALQKWLYDLACVRLSCPVRYYIDLADALKPLSSKVDMARLFDLQQMLNTLRPLVIHPLNHTLQLERVLTQYSKIFHS